MTAPETTCTTTNDPLEHFSEWGFGAISAADQTIMRGIILEIHGDQMAIPRVSWVEITRAIENGKPLLANIKLQTELMGQMFDKLAGFLLGKGALTEEVLCLLPTVIDDITDCGGWHVCRWPSTFDAALQIWQGRLLQVAQVTMWPPSGKPATTKARIDDFLERAATAAAGRKINRTDFWRSAGYTNATEFERFQRDASNTTLAARKVFERTLAMSPEEFLLQRYFLKT